METPAAQNQLQTKPCLPTLLRLRKQPTAGSPASPHHPRRCMDMT